ncbi:Bystin, partial [Fragariocoptes setiger]
MDEIDADTLIKIIEQKHEELESEFRPDDFNDGTRFVKNLDPKVSELYMGVREVLSKYRSGQLPKAFKVIPTLSNWEQILQITAPNKWTAASMFAATKLFSSNLREDMAQRFYNIILLPRIRDDIAEYKKLNHHLYQALLRSLYKPGAFFKGIILPLCEDSESGTLREAVIVASVLPKKHIPILHSAAALLKIAELPFSAYSCVFMHALITKNYALPIRVVGALVDYFVRLKDEPDLHLPVAWHQMLLAFCELYSGDMSDDQRNYLIDLIRVHTHHQVTSVIRSHILKASRRTHNDPIDRNNAKSPTHSIESMEIESK